MSKLFAILSVVGMALVFTACEPVDEQDGAAGAAVVTGEQALTAGALPTTGYFYAVRDTRRCLYPLCSGYFISRVNGGTLTCANGTKASSCYVAQGDFWNLALSEDQLSTAVAGAAKKLVVFQGVMLGKEYEGYGNLGRFVAHRAYAAATETVPSSSTPLYMAYDNGIRCIKAPCPSLDGVKLNTTTTPTKLTDLILTGVKGATEEQLAAASAALGDNGLVVAGTISTSYWTKQTKLTAKQFYLRLMPTFNPTLYCEADVDCVLSPFSGAINSKAECYCALCPTNIINTASAELWPEEWATFCVGLRCPLPLCRKPVIGPACVDNTCVGVPIDETVSN